MVLSFSGCNNRGTVINPEIDETARSYLKALNVTESYITDIDYQAIDKYEIPEQILDYAYVSSSMDEVLGVYYYFYDSLDEYVQDGNMIRFSCTIKDKTGNVIHDYKDGSILVGSGNLKLLEQKVLSKRKGDTIKITPNTKLRDFFGIPAHTFMEIKILEIFDLTEKSSTKKSLSANGFNSLLDFYNFIFTQKVGEYYFEKTLEAYNEFIDFATEHCEFNIAYEDLKNYTRQVVEDETAFFFECSVHANREIKTALVIGALAKHNNIHINSKDYKDFCSKNNVDLNDEVSKALVEYHFLKSAVIKHYTSANLITYRFD